MLPYKLLNSADPIAHFGWPLAKSLYLFTLQGIWSKLLLAVTSRKRPPRLHILGGRLQEVQL